MLLVVGIILISFYFSQEKEETSYVLHEWGVLLKDSIRTNPLTDHVVRVLKPVIYIYSDNDFELSLSIEFENGEAEEIWPYIPTGKKISWNNFEVFSDCETTPFPEQQWDMKEIYGLGHYVVDSANCITYENTTSKILFYNGKIDFGNIITGYYIDSGDKKQIILTNNLEQDMEDIYINYKKSLGAYSAIPEDHPINVTLGILKVDKLKAGETKTFNMTINTYNAFTIPIFWENQAKEFKQKLINKGLYTDEANKFMIAWEDTFFGIHYGYDSNMDYRDGMNIIYVLPEEKYSQLFKLETSIKPQEIKRIGVVYSSIEESVLTGETISPTVGVLISGENCESYTNQIKIYCNPFLSTHDEELCGVAEQNYEDNDCCQSES